MTRIKYLKPIVMDSALRIQHWSNDRWFGRKGLSDKESSMYHHPGVHNNGDSVINKLYINGLLGPVNAYKFNNDVRHLFE